MSALRIARVAGHHVDIERHRLTDGAGREVSLRPQALELLCLLAERAGEVVDKRLAMERIWPGLVVTDDSLVQAVADIRRALGDDGHRTIQTVPRRGYRLIADESAAEAAVESGAAPVVAAAPSPELAPPAVTAVAAAGVSPAPRRPYWMRRISMGVVAAVVLAGALWAGGIWRLPGQQGLWRPVLAVLPFRAESARADDALLGEGMAEELVADLARDVDVTVVSPRSSFLPELQTLAPQEVAQRLRVRYLVDGRLRRDGERLVLRAQLVDGGDGRVLWTQDAAVAIEHWAAARGDLLNRIAGSARSSIWRVDKQRVLTQPAASLDVYAQVVRAYALKHRFNGPAYREGRALAEAAIAREPQNAMAWAVLGYLNSLDANNGFTGTWGPEDRPRALTQIDRALELDPHLPLAHQARVNALRALGRHQDAVASGRRSVELAPGDADNLVMLAFALASVGDTQAAGHAMDQALPLYPIKPAYVAAVDAEVRWAQRDTARALAAAEECIARAPRYTYCQVVRAIALLESGRQDEARQQIDQAQAQSPVSTQAHLQRSFDGEPGVRRRAAAAALGAASSAGS